MIPLMALIACNEEEPMILDPISANCSVDANFSGIAYNEGCDQSFARTSSTLTQIYIISESEDRSMKGRFYMDNLDVSEKTLTEPVNLIWRIGTEGATSPSTILTNIEFEITSNNGSEISGTCMIPFDDQGFVNLDTLWMSFENIVIVE